MHPTADENLHIRRKNSNFVPEFKTEGSGNKEADQINGLFLNVKRASYMFNPSAKSLDHLAL